MDMKNGGAAVAALLIAAGVPGIAYSQGKGAADNYPSKPIRFLVPYAPGGPTDILARVVGAKLTEKWGQQVIVDNRSGANGAIAAELAAKSPPDGHTLFLGNTSILTINPALYAKLPYDAAKDFAPVNLTVAAPLVLVLQSSMPVKTVDDLVKLARAKPGTLSYGSSGSGGVAHLAGELMESLTGVDMIHVPYKGASLMVNDVLAGQVTMSFAGTVTALPHVKSGRLRALGVTTPKRAASLPDIPSIAETIPGYDVSPWYGVLVPAATPKPLIAKLAAEINRITGMSDVSSKLQSDGGDIVSAGPEAFQAMITKERAKWAKLVKDAGIKLEQ